MLTPRLFTEDSDSENVPESSSQGQSDSEDLFSSSQDNAVVKARSSSAQDNTPVKSRSSSSQSQNNNLDELKSALCNDATLASPTLCEETIDTTVVGGPVEEDSEEESEEEEEEKEGRSKKAEEPSNDVYNQATQPLTPKSNGTVEEEDSIVLDGDDDEEETQDVSGRATDKMAATPKGKEELKGSGERGMLERKRRNSGPHDREPPWKKFELDWVSLWLYHLQSPFFMGLAVLAKYRL